ncbi:MAG: hypothetical protein CVU42_04720 [Chloroflexi bacterium HGW-Chloroflexi-4]|jgi:heat shock protein HslJ|nr:MAG: hypothetical protein CVU42_04720 [Chloroflexi bacterium HGW-Chloroflexi-4]
MKKLLATILVIFTVLALLSACSTQSSVTDTQWQLSRLNGKTPLAETTVTLNFSKDAIGGSDGCNSYGGSYASTNETITFGDDIFSTEMYCTDEIAVQSQAYYQALNQTSVYTIGDGKLALMDGNGLVLAEFVTNQN